MKECLRRLHNLSALIGSTPLLAIEYHFRGRERTIYAKAEYLSMTGSIKDRMASIILREGYRRGELQPGGRIIEVSSGNTGISFAAIGSVLDHPVTIFIPDWVSRERSLLLGGLGAELIFFSREEGGFAGALERAEQLVRDHDNAFLANQFSNPDNIRAHYETTGPEILQQLEALSLYPDGFVAGVGTGGSVMGIGCFLQERIPGVAIHPLEPASAPLSPYPDQNGTHRIEGLSDGLLPPVLDREGLAEMVSVEDGDAIVMAQKLAAEVGLGVGISSGANFLGAVKVQEEMADDGVVVTLFADDNKKYLSTDLFKQEPVREEYLSPHISLSGLRAFAVD
ncbi:MAG: PLP-dependent cysteine synthase family protein [Thermodesulfobacteriota bacterium]